MKWIGWGIEDFWLKVELKKWGIVNEERLKSFDDMRMADGGCRGKILELETQTGKATGSNYHSISVLLLLLSPRFSFTLFLSLWLFLTLLHFHFPFPSPSPSSLSVYITVFTICTIYTLHTHYTIFKSQVSSFKHNVVDLRFNSRQDKRQNKSQRVKRSK